MKTCREGNVGVSGTVDWYLDPTDPEALRELRQDVLAYLGRHAEPEADLAGTELVLTELATNVAKHATGPAWVELEWSGDLPALTVYDLGPGFTLETISLPADPLSPGGRGLFIVSHLVEELRVARREAGSKVSATLPVRRSAERSYDPPRRARAALPAPEEADASGHFGKEPFLRALVVQLAQHLEREHGPDAAEAAVAQVGADVGGRMEEEYRRVRELADALTPDQMADLYVRLKAAIDGDFYVIEATEERIVLGNRRCPFGEAVKRAPTLCRMTSSVFGGIAARNTGAAAVHLEERIALGDPGCRVTVWLGLAATDAGSAAHRYERSPTPG